MFLCLHLLTPASDSHQNPDNTDVNRMNTFAHSPSNFDFSSLGNLSSPSLLGITSSLGTGAGLPPLLTGTPAAETVATHSCIARTDDGSGTPFNTRA